MKRAVLKKLAQLTLLPAPPATEGAAEVNEEVASYVLDQLARSQLKDYLFELRAEVARGIVSASVSGGARGPVESGLGRRFGDKQALVSIDESLGAGLIVTAGNDRLDASIKGLFRQTIEKLRKP